MEYFILILAYILGTLIGFKAGNNYGRDKGFSDTCDFFAGRTIEFKRAKDGTIQITDYNENEA